MQKKKTVQVIVGVIVAAFIVIQFIPVKLANPPVETDMPAPADVKAILKTSCYDCHSNETVWPWYSRVAPASWLLASDAKEARKRLNFSTWNLYTPEKQDVLISDMIDQINEGEMPPLPYTWMHSGSAVTPDELNILKAWAASSGKSKPK